MQWTGRLAVLVMLVGFAPAAFGTDWPDWRGPNGNLTSRLGVFEAGGAYQPEVLWQRSVGLGYSGVVVVGERAVTMFSDGGRDVVAALAVDGGAELWRAVLAETYAGQSGSEGGPVGSPVVAGERVFALGPRGDLVALRLADGSQLWRRNLVEDFEAEAPFYGFSTTPIVVDGVLVVQAGSAQAAVLGFDLADGSELWRAGGGAVHHQSPLATSVAGEGIVLALTLEELLGIRPGTGEILFRAPSGMRKNDAAAQPVMVGEGRVLLSDWGGTAVFEITVEDSATEGATGLTVRELWRSERLRRHHVMPIFHEGHVYAYSGRFLHCFDPATGEILWKSRPPGGDAGLTLVDGHLILVVPGGELVLARASPEGYREVGRWKIFDRRTLTPASAAGGRFFFRVKDEVTSLAFRRRDAPAAAERATLPAASAFGAFLGALDKAPPEARRRRVEEFLAEHPEAPILEAGGWAHFVYRGEAEDVALEGSFLEIGEARSLRRIEATDLFHLSLRLEPATHWEYRFVVDYEEAAADPRNPRRLPGGELSELLLPGWEMPDFLGESEGPRGRIEELELEDGSRAGFRTVSVYLPPSYDEAETSYPLLIVNQGDEALASGGMARILDHLVAAGAPALVAAFVPGSRYGEMGGPGSGGYAELLVETLLPKLEAAYRLKKEREARAIFGAAEGGAAALYVALSRPEVFGAFAAQSFFNRPSVAEELGRRLDALEAREASFRCFLGWSRNDLKSETGLEQTSWMARDAEADSRELARRLTKSGVRCVEDVTADGAGWGSWRARWDRLVPALYPQAADHAQMTAEEVDESRP